MAKYTHYSVTKEVKDKNGKIYTVFVYGELKEQKELDGIEVRRVRYKRGSKKVISAIKETVLYPLGDNRSPSKTLNFGWAVCAPEDTFDIAKGILIAKKRFSKAPITTQDCRFLKKDMVLAILNQTAEYVATHELQDFFNRRDMAK